MIRRVAALLAVLLIFAAVPAGAQDHDGEPSRPIVEARDRVLTYPPRGADPLVCDGVTVNTITAATQRWEIDFRAEPIQGPDKFAPSEHATTRLEVLSDVVFDARGNMRAQPDWDVVLHHWNLEAAAGNGWREMIFSNTYKMTAGLWAFRSTTTGDVSGIVTSTLCLVEVAAPLTAYESAAARTTAPRPAEWLAAAG